MKRKILKQFFVFGFFLLLIIPLAGQTAGLVPCGGPSEKPCTACDLVVLFQNVLKFALTMAFLIVVIFVIYGGFRWMFSGGNAANIKAGQQAVTSAVIGLIIILSAWLIINTVFWVIAKMGGDDYTGTGAAPWFQIECKK